MTRANTAENSTIRALSDLMQLEDNRQKKEVEARFAAEEAKRKARLESERRAREEEARRMREAEEVRVKAEKEKEQAEFERLKELEAARSAAKRRAELEIQERIIAHEEQIAIIERDARKVPGSVWIAVAVVALISAGAGLFLNHMHRQEKEQMLSATLSEKERLAAQLDHISRATDERISDQNAALERAQREARMAREALEKKIALENARPKPIGNKPAVRPNRPENETNSLPHIGPIDSNPLSEIDLDGKKKKATVKGDDLLNLER